MLFFRPAPIVALILTIAFIISLLMIRTLNKSEKKYPRPISISFIGGLILILILIIPSIQQIRIEEITKLGLLFSDHSYLWYTSILISIFLMPIFLLKHKKGNTNLNNNLSHKETKKENHLNENTGDGKDIIVNDNKSIPKSSFLLLVAIYSIYICIICPYEFLRFTTILLAFYFIIILSITIFSVLQLPNKTKGKDWNITIISFFLTLSSFIGITPNALSELLAGQDDSSNILEAKYVYSIKRAELSDAKILFGQFIEEGTDITLSPRLAESFFEVMQKFKKDSTGMHDFYNKYVHMIKKSQIKHKSAAIYMGQAHLLLVNTLCDTNNQTELNKARKIYDGFKQFFYTIEPIGINAHYGIMMGTSLIEKYANIKSRDEARTILTDMTGWVKLAQCAEVIEQEAVEAKKFEYSQSYRGEQPTPTLIRHNHFVRDENLKNCNELAAIAASNYVKMQSNISKEDLQLALSLMKYTGGFEKIHPLINTALIEAIESSGENSFVIFDVLQFYNSPLGSYHSANKSQIKKLYLATRARIGSAIQALSAGTTGAEELDDESVYKAMAFLRSKITDDTADIFAETLTLAFKEYPNIDINILGNIFYSLEEASLPLPDAILRAYGYLFYFLAANSEIEKFKDMYSCIAFDRIYDEKVRKENLFISKILSISQEEKYKELYKKNNIVICFIIDSFGNKMNDSSLLEILKAIEPLWPWFEENVNEGIRSIVKIDEQFQSNNATPDWGSRIASFINRIPRDTFAENEKDISTLVMRCINSMPASEIENIVEGVFAVSQKNYKDNYNSFEEMNKKIIDPKRKGALEISYISYLSKLIIKLSKNGKTKDDIMSITEAFRFAADRNVMYAKLPWGERLLDAARAVVIAYHDFFGEYSQEFDEFYAIANMVVSEGKPKSNFRKHYIGALIDMHCKKFSLTSFMLLKNELFKNKTDYAGDVTELSYDMDVMEQTKKLFEYALNFKDINNIHNIEYHIENTSAEICRLYARMIKTKRYDEHYTIDKDIDEIIYLFPHNNGEIYSILIDIICFYFDSDDFKISKHIYGKIITSTNIDSLPKSIEQRVQAKFGELTAENIEDKFMPIFILYSSKIYDQLTEMLKTNRVRLSERLANGQNFTSPVTKIQNLFAMLQRSPDAKVIKIPSDFIKEAIPVVGIFSSKTDYPSTAQTITDFILDSDMADSGDTALLHSLCKTFTDGVTNRKNSKKWQSTIEKCRPHMSN